MSPVRHRCFSASDSLRAQTEELLVTLVPRSLTAQAAPASPLRAHRPLEAQRSGGCGHTADPIQFPKELVLFGVRVQPLPGRFLSHMSHGRCTPKTSGVATTAGTQEHTPADEGRCSVQGLHPEPFPGTGCGTEQQGNRAQRRADTHEPFRGDPAMTHDRRQQASLTVMPGTSPSEPMMPNRMNQASARRARRLTPRPTDLAPVTTSLQVCKSRVWVP